VKRTQSSADPVQALLKRTQSLWVLLAQTALWMAGAIATFLLPPPTGTPDESRIWVRFAQFVITILVGLLLLGALRWQRPKHVFRWAALSLSSLALGTILFFTYQILSSTWTAAYAGQRVIVGGTYTSFGREYLAEHPKLDADGLVMHVSGDVDKIWTRQSRDQRRWILTAIYVLAMPLFTVSLMGIVQAVQCAAARRASGKKAAG
jgi:hypothetical protein